MNFVAALLAGVLFASIYRLLRHKVIIPNSKSESLLVAWSKILAIIFVVTIVLWIVVILLQNFPD